MLATFISAALKGKELLKGTSTGGGGFLDSTTTPTTTTNQKFIPESTGLIAGSVHFLILCLFVPIPYYTHLLPDSFLPGSTAFISSSTTNSNRQSTYLTSVSFDLFDRLFGEHSFASVRCLSRFCEQGKFDIRRRFKLPMHTSVSLLTVYAASAGSTHIVIPHIFGLRNLFAVQDTNGLSCIGPLYHIDMSMLSTFCTNSINILAGINGIEVGQSVMICLSIICNYLLYVNFDLNIFGVNFIFNLGLGNHPKLLQDCHLFLVCLMVPLLAVMLALIKFNWYPAKAFVGDAFCYFSGMSFATVGILGHFSKTLLLFSIPQIMNLVYSIPQSFGFILISRHRLPARDLLSNLLNPSMVIFIKPLSNLTTKTKILNVVKFLKLVKIDRNKEGLIIGCSNLTLLNLVLIWFPNKLNEEQLTIIILGFQFVSNSFGGFFICYYLSDLSYDSHLR
ncbi:hypothetical protein PSTG_00389 [Puccinia striiformis f. sp. tritici PST-78]|uniref:UDP-N-acetylglucosamine--dolichyl-phosphate N-acetylglucosaminephosphotransferase n=1 Tax=Puccinia striiformis f. sp. tritici PST-78 TaxID=1165861 RepID=A0A0L0W4R1_9BASI|nr:hypothetical protein PSTG_00389 [Puccinia striiformis f. sp. tritici PST-78]